MDKDIANNCGDNGDNDDDNLIDLDDPTDCKIVNQPPYTEDEDFDSYYCPPEISNPGTGRIDFIWTYKDKEHDKQAQYRIQIATNRKFDKNSLVLDHTANLVVQDGDKDIVSVTVRQNPNPQNLEIGFNKPYFWRVRVKAATGNLNWSEWKEGPPFNTPRHPWPWPDFSWTPSSPVIGEEVKFSTDTPPHKTIFYDGVCELNPDNLSCKYMWVFPGGNPVPPDNVNTREPKVIFEDGDRSRTITLTVTDSDGYTCSKDREIEFGEPREHPRLRWREISPFF